jgi:hypothetical protein
MANQSNWKGDERLVAGIFGTERTPLSGGNSKITRSDTMHKRLFIEVKKRKSHAVAELWKKTKLLADKEKKIPVVALRSGNSKYTLIVVEINDIEAVVAEIAKEPTRKPARRIE